jgi:hypothetical protein
MTPLGINPATFQFVAQCLNHGATTCPQAKQSTQYKYPKDDDSYVFGD